MWLARVDGLWTMERRTAVRCGWVPRVAEKGEEGNVQTVILAGGLGTRLRSVDATVPKPMIDVCGRPFLGRLMDMLRGHGLTDFLLLLGYKSEIIIEYVKRSCADCHVEWSVEPTPMGTGGALKLAEPKLADAFLMINGDSFLNMDYEDFSAKFRAAKTLAAMTVFDNRLNTNVRNNVAISERGSVAIYRKAGGPDLTHVEAGVLAYRRAILDLIPAARPCSMENEIYPELISRGEMSMYEVQGRFYDVGTPAQLEEFREVVQRDHL